MKNNNQFMTIKYIGGICTLAGGAIGIALGLRGETSFLILGLISLATGVSIFFSMSKR